MDASKIGGLIAEIRKEKGWTQKELAEHLHVSDKAVSKWETGRGTPDISSLELLSEVLEVSVNELLAGKRFTNAEFPKNSDTVLVHTLRRSRKNMLILVLVLISLLVLGICAFFGVHYFTSVDGEDTERIYSRIKEAEERRYDTEITDFEICQVTEKSDCRAILVRQNGNYELYEFERDSVFRNRWHLWGGSEQLVGKLGSLHFKMTTNPAAIVVFGGDLPEEAAYYMLPAESDRVVVVPIVNRQVLEIHLQPDTVDLGSPPILLDGEFRVLGSTADDTLLARLAEYAESVRNAE